jgi:aspartyl-tRNA(Asn)/glutamyl-tRNA(Gln) amidotransferase subunit C
MASITVEQVKKIAELAHLQFSPEELQRFIPQFQEVLYYIAQLDDVSTENVEATYHVLERGSRPVSMREDQEEPSLPVETVLANAPDSAEGHFCVPAVLEEE